MIKFILFFYYFYEKNQSDFYIIYVIDSGGDLLVQGKGINKGNISSCCKGKRKSAGGFIWKYVEEEF